GRFLELAEQVMQDRLRETLRVLAALLQDGMNRVRQLLNRLLDGEESLLAPPFEGQFPGLSRTFAVGNRGPGRGQDKRRRRRLCVFGRLGRNQGSVSLIGRRRLGGCGY